MKRVDNLKIPKRNFEEILKIGKEENYIRVTVNIFNQVKNRNNCQVIIFYFKKEKIKSINGVIE